MIELRWLERDVPNLHPATNIAHGRPRETVLQYRSWSDIMPKTPWTDVPKEIEKPHPVGNLIYGNPVPMPEFP